jgi:cell division protein FtsQ
VPLVTNFPGNKKMSPRDSALLKDVKELTTFISKDPFWNAQVAQIDIVGDKNFELIPTIGNHIIRIGSADALEEKLNRLFVFYKNVLSKTGFDHYSVIDVQYKDQVVATQKGTVSKVDALQLQKNIEELMKKAQQAQEAQQPMVIDSTNQLQVNNSHEAFDAVQTQESIEKPDLPNPSGITKTTTTKPSPTLKETTAKLKTTTKKKVAKPKAVMRP